MTTHYAAVQPSTHSVFGIGATVEEALRDAHVNCARRDEVDPEALAVVPCTDAARQYVEENGGAPSRDLSVSIFSGVSLRSEEA